MASPGSPTPRVLILDASDESRLVLSELLGRSGVASTPVSRAAEAFATLDSGAAASLVVDIDGFSSRELELLADRCVRSDTAIVAIGTNRAESLGVAATLVRKPYHYRELIHKIWASLGSGGNQARAAA